MVSTASFPRTRCRPGLDPAKHVIVEIATLLTDDDLNIVESGPDLVIHATDEELAAIFVDLQDRGCHNINWVSPTHQVAAMVEALAIVGRTQEAL